LTDSVAKASILTLAGTWLATPLGIAVNVLLARALGPHIKGLYAVFLATQGLLVLPGFAVQQALTHLIASKKPDAAVLRPFLRILVLGQSLVSAGLLFALIQFPSIRSLIFTGLTSFYVLPVLGFVAINLAILYRGALVSGLQMYSRTAIVSNLASMISSLALMAVLAVWLLRGVTPSLPSVIIASLFSTVVALSVWLFGTRNIQLPPGEGISTREMSRSVTSFASPVALRVVLEWVNLRVDVYFVNAFAGATALGVYTVSVGIAQQLWAVPFSVASPLFAKIAGQGDTENSRQTVRFAFRVLILVTLLLCVFVAVVSNLLVPLLYGRRFAGATALLIVLLPGVVLIGPTRVIASYLAGIQLPSEVLRAEIVGLCATVALDVLLIPRMGAMGASIASSAAYSIYAAVLVYRFLRISRSTWSDLFVVRRADILQTRNQVGEILPSRDTLGRLARWRPY
jgi:O-antigen/teichoic acid export membrane protein